MDNNKKIIPIAQKSKGYIFLMIFAEVLFISGFVVLRFMSDGTMEKFVQAVCLLLGLGFLIHIIYLLLLPNDLICATEKGFVVKTVGNQELDIPFDQIIEVIQKNSQARSFQYPFGSIIIVTSDTRIRIRGISGVNKVKSKMVEIIATYKAKNASE